MRRPTAAAVVISVLWTAAATLSHAETIRVEIKDLAFAPAAITAHVGDVIEWANNDFLDHTATGKNGEWEVNLPPDGSGRIEIKGPGGKLEYYCRYHPNMMGEITIK